MYVYIIIKSIVTRYSVTPCGPYGLDPLFAPCYTSVTLNSTRYNLVVRQIGAFQDLPTLRPLPTLPASRGGWPFREVKACAILIETV